MTEKPPEDAADHAEDFSWRYAPDLEIVAGQAMMDLGLTDFETGARDPDRDREHHCFFPADRTGGGISPAGQVTLDSGLMNPDLLAANYDAPAQPCWRRTRIEDQAQAIIAHELEEYAHDGDHELALIAGPETARPISRAARDLLRAMESGWKGR